MPKLADIDVYELASALGKERSALVNAAKQEGRRTTDTERVTICVLQALARALKAAADKVPREDWTVGTWLSLIYSNRRIRQRHQYALPRSQGEGSHAW